MSMGVPITHTMTVTMPIPTLMCMRRAARVCVRVHVRVAYIAYIFVCVWRAVGVTVSV